MYLNPAVCTRIFRKLVIFLLSPSNPNMNTKRILEKSTFEFSNVEAAYTQADFDSRANDTNGRDISVASVDTGVILACKNASGPGSVLYTIVLDSSSARERINEDIVLNGNELLTVGDTLSDMKKAGVGAVEEQRDMTHSGPLKRASPTHCLVLNGKLPDCFMHTDIMTRGEAAVGLQATQGWNATPEERLPLPSSHIPVPRHRNPSGHADKEVMAATVLTSLSTSPLVLNPGPPPTVAAPEPTTRGWKDPLSASYSSSTSGNWSWDTSDQSVPSTPSPPLSNDAGKSFLLASPRDDATEDAGESTHFLFDDPIPRKRKVGMGSGGYRAPCGCIAEPDRKGRARTVEEDKANTSHLPSCSC